MRTRTSQTSTGNENKNREGVTLRTSTGARLSRAFLENEILVLRQHRDHLARDLDREKQSRQDGEEKLARLAGETNALRNRAADAENRSDFLKKDLDSARRQLEDLSARVSDLHAKVGERENAIVALGIRLGEMKLNESYGGTGR